MLVALEVSRAKLERELEAFRLQEESNRRRGIVLLARDDLAVDVGFLCRLPLDPLRSLTAMPIAVRIDFSNYDLWAPSVDFIDPVTRAPLPYPPILEGLVFRTDGVPLPRGPSRVFLEAHPETGRPFVCKRGVREYHSHPEHNGDDWLLHRGDNLGTLSHLVDVIWRHSTRQVTGLHVVMQRAEIQAAIGNVLVSRMQLQLRSEDVDALTEQVTAELAQLGQAAPAQVPLAQQVALAEQAALAPQAALAQQAAVTQQAAAAPLPDEPPAR